MMLHVVAGLHIGGDCANVRQLKLDIRYKRWKKVLDWLETLSEAELSPFGEETAGAIALIVASLLLLLLLLSSYTPTPLVTCLLLSHGAITLIVHSLRSSYHLFAPHITSSLLV